MRCGRRAATRDCPSAQGITCLNGEQARRRDGPRKGRRVNGPSRESPAGAAPAGPPPWWRRAPRTPGQWRGNCQPRPEPRVLSHAPWRPAGDIAAPYSRAVLPAKACASRGTPTVVGTSEQAREDGRCFRAFIAAALIALDHHLDLVPQIRMTFLETAIGAGAASRHVPLPLANRLASSCAERNVQVIGQLVSDGCHRFGVTRVTGVLRRPARPSVRGAPP